MALRARKVSGAFEKRAPGHHNTEKRSGIEDVWKPAVGKKLHAEHELDNEVNKFAMKVVKNSGTVGHLPCEYS